MSDNTSNVSGDNNVVVQGITAARDVIMNFDTSGLSKEVKEKKESLKVIIEDLVGQLDAIGAQFANEAEPPPFDPPDDPEYSKIKWRRLMQSLEPENDGCVLFIGPEISVNELGKSLHKEFFLDLAEEEDDIEFLEQEGFFSPLPEEDILYDVKRFYNKEFPRKNKKGRDLLEKTAQIPFSLIVSMCPDDTMRRIYEDYNLKHRFLFFDTTKQEIDRPLRNDPVLYNILGNAAGTGKFIFTHEHFYNYLNKVIIPSEIKKKIQDATHYLFLGFDLDKWYNRLLLFILDFKQTKKGLIVGNKSVKEDIEKFIQMQFNITFVNNDYSQFVDWLLQNSAERGNILRNLNKAFVQLIDQELAGLITRVNDEVKEDGLNKIEEEAKAIGAKIAHFKQRITE